MKINVLFLDDIFSEIFRQTLDGEQLAFDDAWVSSIEKSLCESNMEGLDFKIFKSGNIDRWHSLIDQEKPDVVLLDLYWPEHARKSGDDRSAVDISLTALKAIREAYPDLPVVQYTVKPDMETMQRSYDAGASFFLEKVPLAIAEVHSTLKYLMVYLTTKTSA